MPAACCDDTAVKKRTRDQGTCGGSGAVFKRKNFSQGAPEDVVKKASEIMQKKAGDTVVL